MKNNFEHTFLSLIKILKAPVTQTTALQYLQSHPYSGSLLAYTETLERFNIDNAGIKIDKERFGELPTPFVAYLHQHGGIFALVSSVSDIDVNWLDTQKGWNKTHKKDFFKTWNGVALLAELNAGSGERDYTQKRGAEIVSSLRLPLALGLLGLGMFFWVIPIFLSGSTHLFQTLIGLKILGMVLSSLLLSQSMGNKNGLIQALCNNGSKVNCQSILDSPAASITSWLTWSDVGFIYFWGSFFALVGCWYSGTVSTFLTFQWIFSVGSLFFSTYSLWYQGLKSKMWCTLCLAVVSVMTVEFLSLLVFLSFNINGSEYGLLYLGMGFSIPVIFLLIYKDTATKALERDSLEKKLNRIYAHPAYLNMLLEHQPMKPNIPDTMPTVFFGNAYAENTITIVSNPLCSPCARMHKQLETLTAENPNVKCRVIFLSGDDNAGGQFVRKLLSLPKYLQTEAMAGWFNSNNKNFDAWNEAYKQYKELDETAHWQKMQREWANDAEVKATPTLYLNNKKKPDEISVKELGVVLAYHNGGQIE